MKDGSEIRPAPGAGPDRRTGPAPYEKPLLRKLGDVRSDVLGPSPGLGDSPINRSLP